MVTSISSGDNGRTWTEATEEPSLDEAIQDACAWTDGHEMAVWVIRGTGCRYVVRNGRVHCPAEVS
jgi:hypothetical protein